jgi:hypothetical protein
MRRPALIVILLLAFALPARAGGVMDFMATIDGAHAVPPNNSDCKGTGTFVLNAAEDALAYDIQFDPWVPDEFISHIHELNAPPPGEVILEEIAPGSHKVGSIGLTASDVIALRDGRLFVVVHTTSYMQGEVRGWIVPATAARASTWGGIKAFYR